MFRSFIAAFKMPPFSAYRKPENTVNASDKHADFANNRLKTGVLIVNLGTPTAPTAKALRPYLKEFLSDPRVVEIPRAIWFFILHGVILRLRPKKSAALYQKIWTDKGSPLLNISQQQQQKLQQVLGNNTVVKLGMRYGSPAIKNALQTFQQMGITRIVILPLYPQYGGPTTGSTFDAVTHELSHWRYVPELHFIHHYYRNNSYINALACSITEALDTNNLPERLLLSYHGMPKYFFQQGDPYYCHSLKTTALLKDKLQTTLGLSGDQIISTFQSRFGKAEWLKPYTDTTVAELAANGIKKIAIACPAFSVDCLETLEEIAVENKQLFMQAGGESYHYIPALNDRDDHINALAEIIQPHLPSVSG